MDEPDDITDEDEARFQSNARRRAQEMRDLSDYDRDRLISAAGDKVIDLREAFRRERRERS